MSSFIVFLYLLIIIVVQTEREASSNSCVALLITNASAFLTLLEIEARAANISQSTYFVVVDFT